MNTLNILFSYLLRTIQVKISYNRAAVYSCFTLLPIVSVVKHPARDGPEPDLTALLSTSTNSTALGADVH